MVNNPLVFYFEKLKDDYDLKTYEDIAKYLDVSIGTIKNAYGLRTVFPSKRLTKHLSERFNKKPEDILNDIYNNSFCEPCNEYIKKLVNIENNETLSQSSLETLAIIAYNSPITRIGVDEIRGVNTVHTIRKLLMKGLIEEKGRAELPGRPILYGITDYFLDYFGLASIDDLPKISFDEEENLDESNLFESRYKEN